MAHHIFRYVNGDMFATIMHRYGVPNHLRENGGGARPGFNDFFSIFVSSLQFVSTVSHGQKVLFLKICSCLFLPSAAT
jgi:hypothetical protein